MEILFLGVGEACDAAHPNTSLHITTSNGACFLLDCGFTTPHIYFGLHPQADELDAVWLSHFHGDHFFGIPLLLLRLGEMGRKKTLIIAGQAGVQKKVHSAMELAYPGFMDTLQYRLAFLNIEPAHTMDVCATGWRTAANVHSQASYSLRLDDGKHSLFYSGDGRPTAQSMTLAQGCDLVVHESFWLDKQVRNHGNVMDSIAFAMKSGAAHLALVHVERKSRHGVQEVLPTLLRDISLPVFLPEDGDIFSL